MTAMSAPYPTATIANWFLDKADDAGKPLDPMKLQKLIYFAHGWYLALTGDPLINEHPEAWEYGPVIPSIYHQFKKYGRNAITEPAWCWDRPWKSNIEDMLQAKPIIPRLEGDEDVHQLLEKIWSVYGSQSAVALSNLSHVANGAWDQAFRAAGGKRSVDISDDLIRTEFDAKKKRGTAA